MEMVKKHVKAILCTLGMLTLIIVGILSLFSFFTILTKGFEFNDENLDDKYGKLDSNTEIVLKETLKTYTKKENVEFFFSFVYEDINQNYAQQLSLNDEAIFIYYNDTTKELNVLSNLELKEDNFKVTLSSKDDLVTDFPNYLNLICDNLQESPTHIYVANATRKSAISFLLFFFCLIVLAAFAPNYIKYIKEYLLCINKENQKIQIKEDNFSDEEENDDLPDDF